MMTLRRPRRQRIRRALWKLGIAGSLAGGAAGCGAGGADACPADPGTGTLSVHVRGAPAGGGAVTVAGMRLTADAELSLPAGPVSLVAARVADSGGTLVRTAYEPTVDDPAPCVRPGESATVEVRYAPIATSGHLWAGDALPPASSTALGFAAEHLSSTDSVNADIAASTGGSGGLTFDAAGNLWVIGATIDDPPLARYPVALLDRSGDKAPDVIIDPTAFAPARGNLSALAFDREGNLWVAVREPGKVVKLAAAALGVSAELAAVAERTDIEGASGLAFDAAGNLWVASSGPAQIIRVDASHLAASGSAGDLSITARSPAPTTTTLPSPSGLAFDGTGALWVNYDGTLAKLSVAELAGQGTVTVTPAVQIALDVVARPVGLAFDEAGGLWFASGPGALARLDPVQLRTSGAAMPTVLTSPDLGYADWIALYPAPAFSPLAHRLP